MKDINKEAEESLLKTGFNIEYHHPKKSTEFPCISFYNLTERSSLSLDNSEAVQTGWVQVDIWGKTPIQCGEMMLKVNEVLKADGWCREMSKDIPDESGIYHKTSRFVKDFIL